MAKFITTSELDIIQDVAFNVGYDGIVLTGEANIHLDFYAAAKEAFYDSIEGQPDHVFKSLVDKLQRSESNSGLTGAEIETVKAAAQLAGVSNAIRIDDDIYTGDVKRTTGKFSQELNDALVANNSLTPELQSINGKMGMNTAYGEREREVLPVTEATGVIQEDISGKSPTPEHDGLIRGELRLFEKMAGEHYDSSGNMVSAYDGDIVSFNGGVNPEFIDEMRSRWPNGFEAIFDNYVFNFDDVVANYGTAQAGQDGYKLDDLKMLAGNIEGRVYNIVERNGDIGKYYKDNSVAQELNARITHFREESEPEIIVEASAKVEPAGEEVDLSPVAEEQNVAAQPEEFAELKPLSDEKFAEMQAQNPGTGVEEEVAIEPVATVAPVAPAVPKAPAKAEKTPEQQAADLGIPPVEMLGGNEETIERVSPADVNIVNEVVGDESVKSSLNQEKSAVTPEIEVEASTLVKVQKESPKNNAVQTAKEEPVAPESKTPETPIETNEKIAQVAPKTEETMPDTKQTNTLENDVPEGYILKPSVDGKPEALYRDVSYTAAEMKELYRVARVLDWERPKENFFTKLLGDAEPKAALNANFTISQQFFDAAKEAGEIGGVKRRDDEGNIVIDKNAASLEKMAARVAPEMTVSEGHDEQNLMVINTAMSGFKGDPSNPSENPIAVRSGQFDSFFKDHYDASSMDRTVKNWVIQADARTETDAINRANPELSNEEPTQLAENSNIAKPNGQVTLGGMISNVNAEVVVQDDVVAEKYSTKGYTIEDLDLMRSSGLVPFSSDAPDNFNSADAMLLRDIAAGFTGEYVLGSNGKPTAEFKEYAEAQPGYSGEYAASSSRPSAQSVIEALDSNIISIQGNTPSIQQSLAILAEVKATETLEPKEAPEAVNAKAETQPAIPSSDSTTLVRISNGQNISFLAEAAGLDLSNWGGDVKPFLNEVARLNGTTREALDNVKAGDEFYFPNSVNGKNYNYERSDIIRNATLAHPIEKVAAVIAEGDLKLSIHKDETLYGIVRDLAIANDVENTSYGALKDTIDEIAKASGIVDMTKIQIGKEVEISGDIFGEDKNLNIPFELSDNLVQKG